MIVHQLLLLLGLVALYTFGPVAAKNCFDASPDSCFDLHDCMTGYWHCSGIEYCQVLHANGLYSLQCYGIRDHGAHSENHCQRSATMACCETEACVRNLLQVAATTSVAATDDHSTLPPCLDLYNGDCSEDFAGMCGDQTVADVCKKTCNNCPCFDHYKGDCAAAFPGQCGNVDIANMCQKTCNTCPQITTTTTTTTTPKPTTIAALCSDHVAGDCATIFAGRCNEPDIQNVCQKTCNLCARTTMAATTTTAATTPRPCSDDFAGDCSVTFVGRCGEDLVSNFICRKTCGTCTSCTDLFTGDCAATFPGRCNEPDIQHVCQRTCNLCDVVLTAKPVTTATTTTTPSPTTAGCTDDNSDFCSLLVDECIKHEVSSKCRLTCNLCEPCEDNFSGDCAAFFGPDQCHVPEIQDVCRKTCNACDVNLAPCVDSHNGTCSEDFTLPDECDLPVIKHVCKKSCGFCAVL